MNYKKIHFVGIGGISMSSLAQILKSKGCQISGSDSNESDITKELEKIGIKVYKGHSKDNITKDIELIVYTAAVKQDNPELEQARKYNIKIIDRAELLGLMMKNYTYPISISGTHGKTTTTSMITEIFLNAGKNPTVSIGGMLNSINGNFKIGSNDYFIVESCEYCDSFLKFKPYSAIILNIDKDHIDYFKNIENIYSSFRKFAQLIPKNGFIVINNNIKDVEKITKDLECEIITYGLKSNSMWYPENITFDENGFPSYNVINNNEKIAEIKLNVVGEHNVLNSLAAFVLSYRHGINIDDIVKGLLNFKGTHRRFEYKGEFNGIKIIDDYAHHPTEIKATLSSVIKNNKNKLWAVFQPHTYSRTKSLLNEFSKSFDYADNIIILDIYAAREKNTGEIHSKDLVEMLNKRGKNAIYINSFENAQNHLIQNCKKGDIIITIGAGNVYEVGENILNKYNTNVL